MGSQGLRRAWHTHVGGKHAKGAAEHFKLLYASQGMQGQNSCMIIGRELV